MNKNLRTIYPRETYPRRVYLLSSGYTRAAIRLENRTGNYFPMQVPWYPPLSQFLSQEPTVGHLMALCEESYAHLVRMAPELKRLKGTYQSCLDEHIDLHLEILNQAPYTTLIHLTYFFDHHEGQQPDPDAVLCVYHDARQVEVVDLKQKDLPLERLFHAPSLRNRWRLNLFACKWLAFCARQGHFFPQDTAREASESHDAATPRLEIEE